MLARWRRPACRSSPLKTRGAFASKSQSMKAISVVAQESRLPSVIDALDNAGLKGKIVQIVPAADAASRTFLVKVELPADTRLRSGLFGRARFPAASGRHC